jgi:hypothetical protein
VFGKGFGAISYLKSNPYDENLYALTFDERQGAILKIVSINK